MFEQIYSADVFLSAFYLGTLLLMQNFTPEIETTDLGDLLRPIFI